MLACWCSIVILSVAITARAHGQTTKPATPSPDGATLLRRARTEENAARYDRAGDLYKQAALAFERAGQSAAQVDALQRSAAAYERYADALTAKPPAAPTPTAPVPAVPTRAAPTPPANTPVPAAVPRRGIQPGLYNCHEWAQGGMAVVRRIEIKNDHDYVFYAYNDRAKLPGQYRFDPQSGAITWVSGHLKGFTGSEYKYEELHSQMRLFFGDPLFHACFRSER